MSEKNCYLCSETPPTGNVKPKDRYYCPDCWENMVEAEEIRTQYVKSRNPATEQKMPKSKQIQISPNKDRS